VVAAATLFARMTCDGDGGRTGLNIWQIARDGHTHARTRPGGCGEKLCQGGGQAFCEKKQQGAERQA